MAGSQLVFTVPPTNTAAGAAITPAVQVAVQDALGNTVTSFSGTVTVTLAANPGGGTLAGHPTVTAVNGVATFADLSIDRVSTGYMLQATGAGWTTASVPFDVTPGAATQLAFTVQPTNTAAGAPITPAVQVTARDASGNTATQFTGNITVALGANQGGATLGCVPTHAAVAGVASFPGLSLNKTGSGYTLTATSGAIALSAGAATQIALNAGNNQTVAAGSAVPIRSSVIVRDGSGNPVAGVAVTFAVAPGNGTITGPNQINDATGIAAVASWTLATTAGANKITATATGLTGSPVTFTATGTAGSAGSIAASAGDRQTATVNTAVTPPAVIVKDQFGNPVAGAAVTFAPASGQGSITGAAQTTNASGIATVGSWTLGKPAGVNTLTATSTGLNGSPVTFNATGTPGAPTSIAVSARNNQSAAVGTAVTTPPAVIVQDQFNNPVASVAVSSASTAAGGPRLPPRRA